MVTPKWQAILLVLPLLGSCAPTASYKASGDIPSVNPDFKLDSNLASAGWVVWRNKGCGVCHAIAQGKMAGPDLYGVVDRRELAWLKRWLLETDVMLDSDPLGQALLKEYNRVRMPNMRLTEEQADAVIHYMARETAEARSGS